MRDGTAKRLSTLHTLLYRTTGGLVGRRLVDNDMLLLTTKGRFTARPHTVPLLYLSGDDHWVVFASWGGRPNHPEWYHNLLSDPRGVVQIDRTKHRVRARTAVGNERDRWWAAAEQAYSGYGGYQSRTEREIPVVLLEPR